MSSQRSSIPPENDLYLGSVVRLASLFYDKVDVLGTFEAVTLAELPPDYQSLLGHTDHMTVTLEAFHNSLVNVQVLDEWQDSASYARTSLLTRQSDGAVVQFGVARIWLDHLPTEVRDAILRKTIPLGRVLIRHNVMRDVEIMTLWRITPGEELRNRLQLQNGQPIYGRSAQILVSERPTMQLLEIVKV